MKIALFGGSFDPVHNEHIRLAKAAIEQLDLDKLFVIPAFSPPHKKWKTISSDEVRLEMCRLAFSGITKVEISDYEILQKGTSYTYLTCRHFRDLYPSSEIYFLMGGDMLRDFPTWKNPTSILQDVTLAACGREEENGWEEVEQKAFLDKFGVPFKAVHYNGGAISSTKIRVLAGAGMPLTGFVPDSVADYIQATGLYAIKNADKALALEKPERREHSIRVAELAASLSERWEVPQKQAIQAALFHDCAKNLPLRHPLLEGFAFREEWGEVPSPVVHQFTGAYLAEKLGIDDEDVLSAIRYHTSGRENMSKLETLIFLADMLEAGRAFDGVEELRLLLNKGNDECLLACLKRSLDFIESKGGEVYPLTKQAYSYYQEKRGESL